MNQFISTLIVMVSFITKNYATDCAVSIQCPNGQFCTGGKCQNNPCVTPNGQEIFCRPNDNTCGNGCECTAYDPTDDLYACTPIQNGIIADGVGCGTKCLPNGCFYDVEIDLTKQIECRPNGRQRIQYFTGNNGCNNSHLLPEKTYYSPKPNPCCIEDSLVADAAVADASTRYHIKIHNTYGSTVDFGVFQVQPLTDGVEGNYATIFTDFKAANSSTGSIDWSLDWGLSYSYGGVGCQPLQSNVIYTLTGDIIPATPGTNANAAQLSYGDDVWKMVPSTMRDLTFNQIGIESLAFSNAAARSECLTVAVTCESEAVFVADGEPSRSYYFTLKPQYYITTQETQIGTTVSAEIKGISQVVDFSNGNTFECEYNDMGEYANCKYSTI